jgi:hypothetical protein
MKLIYFSIAECIKLKALEKEDKAYERGVSTDSVALYQRRRGEEDLKQMKGWL